MPESDVSPRRRWQERARALVTIFILSGASVHAAEPPPTVDQDGLHLVEGSEAMIAYLQPGADLGKFDKVMILDCFVEFREKWARDYNLDVVGLQGRVSDRDMERIKTKLSVEFHKVFAEELSADGYPIVDKPAPGVLLLRPAIVNLDVTAPDTMRASRGNTWVRSAAQMTLYMEMYDAETDELLARVIDPRADSDAIPQIANSVTNRAAARTIIRYWARLLGDRLNTMKGRAGS